MLDWFRASPACDANSIGAALVAANDALLGERQRDAGLAVMHATAVVLAIAGVPGNGPSALGRRGVGSC